MSVWGPARVAAAKRGCSGGYMGGEVDGVDDASLDGAELDLDGAERDV